MKKCFILIATMTLVTNAYATCIPAYSQEESSTSMLASSSSTTLSGSFPVKKNGKNIGTVSYSVEFQETSRGIFAHCIFENNTDEQVVVYLSNISGVTNVHVAPWKKAEVTGSTDQIPSRISGDVYCR